MKEVKRLCASRGDASRQCCQGSAVIRSFPPNTLHTHPPLCKFRTPLSPRLRLSALNLLFSHLVYSELSLLLLLSPCSVYSIFQQPSGECDPSHVPLLPPLTPAAPPTPTVPCCGRTIVRLFPRLHRQLSIKRKYPKTINQRRCSNTRHNVYHISIYQRCNTFSSSG